jgi:hypothetical protein
MLVALNPMSSIMEDNKDNVEVVKRSMQAAPFCEVGAERLTIH